MLVLILIRLLHLLSEVWQDGTRTSVALYMENRKAHNYELRNEKI